MEFNQTKTFANLMSAFAGESQARNKYTYYAQQAKTDGYVHIQEIFEETAKNELAHAKIWYKLVNNGGSTTEDNLKDAAGGEHFEWSEMYADYAKIAKEEGYDKIAFLFEGVAKIEKEHETRFRKYITQLEQNQAFKRPASISWKCENCGHEQEGTDAPEVCPVCAHKQSFFADEEDVIA